MRLPAPGSTDLTRRQLLVAAGGVSLAVLVHAPPARAAEAVEAERLGTLAAVLGALACGPLSGLTDAGAAAYVEDFAAFRAAGDQHFRRYADRALDDIGATGFALFEPEAAYAELQRWAARPDLAERAAAALDLATLTFATDVDGHQAGYALTGS